MAVWEAIYGGMLLQEHVRIQHPLLLTRSPETSFPLSIFWPPAIHSMSSITTKLDGYLARETKGKMDGVDRIRTYTLL